MLAHRLRPVLARLSSEAAVHRHAEVGDVPRCGVDPAAQPGDPVDRQHNTEERPGAASRRCARSWRPRSSPSGPAAPCPAPRTSATRGTSRSTGGSRRGPPRGSAWSAASPARRIAPMLPLTSRRAPAQGPGSCRQGPTEWRGRTAGSRRRAGGFPWRPGSRSRARQSDSRARSQPLKALSALAGNGRQTRKRTPSGMTPAVRRGNPVGDSVSERGTMPSFGRTSLSRS